MQRLGAWWLTAYRASLSGWGLKLCLIDMILHECAHPYRIKIPYIIFVSIYAISICFDTREDCGFEDVRCLGFSIFIWNRVSEKRVVRFVI